MAKNTKDIYNCDDAKSRLIFACSGGADVGHLSDQAARLIMKEGHGKMFCLAGIGGKVKGILQTTEDADSILVIDGCPVDCAKKTLEEAGIEDFTQFQITAIGFEKGKTEVTDANIRKVTDYAKGIF